MIYERRSRLGYDGLIELARSRNIQVIETRGLSDSHGLRFSNSGRQCIALNSDLPETEKTRTLGFLLENYSGGAQESGRILSLQCPGI